MRTRCIVMTTYLVCMIQHVSSKLTGNAQESIRTYYVRTFVRLGCPNLTRKVFAHLSLARIVSSRFCLSVSHCIRTIVRTQTCRFRAVFRGGASVLNIPRCHTRAGCIRARARDTGNARAGRLSRAHKRLKHARTFLVACIITKQAIIATYAPV